MVAARADTRVRASRLAALVRNVVDQSGQLVAFRVSESSGRKRAGDVARSVGYLAGVTAKVVETADLSLRLEKVEAAIAAKQAETGR